MFERGILGKGIFIKDIACPIVANMEEGFKLFSSWLDEKLLQDDSLYMHVIDDTVSTSTFLGYKITEQSGKLFLSWQTWDLLKLMFHGFKSLCDDFLTVHPGYRIYPVRLNGSAVETLFSQVKHATSGHLSATNYATARSAVLTKGSIHGKVRCHRGDYRNGPLHIRRHPLLRKPYKRCKPSK